MSPEAEKGKTGSASVPAGPVSSPGPTLSHLPAAPPIAVSPQGEAALRRGLAASQANRPAEAIRAFASAVESDPRSPLTHDYLGIAYLQQRRFPLALRQFHEEINCEPDSATGWARIADVYRSQGRPRDTIQALERAVALQPNLAQLHLNLGVVYPEVMELSKGVEELKRCVALEPGNSYGHYLLGNLLYKLSQLDEAEQALQEAIRLAPQQGLYHFGLAQVYLKRAATPENTQRALTELTTALQLGVPEPAAAHYNLGLCYQRQEKWDEARKELETSVKLAPNAWAAYYALQDVLLRMGKTAEARQALARFRVLRAREDRHRQQAFYVQEAQRNPDSPDAQFQLAEYLSQSGNRAQARQALERAKRLASGGKGVPGLPKRIAALSAQLRRP